MGKRKAVELDVKVLKPQANTVPPAVCYFSSGKPTSAEPLDLKLYSHAQRTVKPRAPSYFAVGHQQNLDYVGSTASYEYSAPQPCRYAVGVCDKEAGTLVLLPIAGDRVCRLEPKVHNLQYEPSDHQAKNQELSREQRLADMHGLVGAFGSTRRKRQMTQREEGVVRVEKLMNADGLLGQAKAIGQEAAAAGRVKEEILKSSFASRMLPPHDDAATTPEAAYPLDKLAPGMECALDTGRLFKAAEDAQHEHKLKDFGIVSPYVLSRLALLRDSNRQQAERRAKYLGLLNGLLRVHSARPTLKLDPQDDLSKLSKAWKVTTELTELLLSLFYNQSGDDATYVQPKDKKNLLRLYIAAVAVVAEGGHLFPDQFEDLRNDLKLSSAEAASLFKEIGAVPAPTTVKRDGGDGLETVRTFRVSLLRDPAAPTKTLKESFPLIKLGPRKGR